MNKQPKVSIIIPVKEVNDYLRESISHILNLNYEDSVVNLERQIEFYRRRI